MVEFKALDETVVVAKDASVTAIIAAGKATETLNEILQRSTRHVILEMKWFDLVR